MELRTHATILKQARWFIILVTVGVALAAYLFAVVQPVKYKGVVSFELGFSSTAENTGQYEYGGYYEQKGAELFTQHLMSLFRSPSFVGDVYTAAGQSYTIDNIGRFTSRFHTSQYSPQHFVVEYTDFNEDVARGLGQAIVEVVEERGTEAGSINEDTVYTVRGHGPVVAIASFTPWLVTVIGFVAGLLMSVILVYLREYFRE